MWRPQQFKDIIGQQHVTQTLQNAIKENRFSHAYLFNGPRGTGKTSAAKVMAKAINCENGPSEEPCNECNACIGISNGSILDVIEMDAASNRRIEDIRELLDKVKYAPTEVQYKVYIVDEVHMLTTEAFNALLKTLEEPPKHVIFILATTEPHKLPLTIISRCQRFDLKRISNLEIVDLLRNIANESGISITDTALIQIAQSSEGGMRDALSLLDQARSFKEDTIDIEDILSITGSLSATVFSTIASKIIAGETSDLLSLVDSFMIDGRDPEKLLEDLTAYFRDVLIYKVAPDLQELKDRQISDTQFSVVSESIKEQQLFELIKICSDAIQQIKWSTNPRIVLELTLIKCSRLDRFEVEGINNGSSIDLSHLEAKIQSLEAKISSLQQQRIDAPVEREVSVKSTVTKVTRLPSTSKVSSEKIKAIFSQKSEAKLNQIRSQWNTILNGVKKQKIAVHAWLVDGEVVAATDQAIALSFKSAIHRETTEKESHRDLIESVIVTVTGNPYKIVTMMQSDWDNISQQEDEPRTESEQKNEESSIDIAEEAIALFGADLVEIKD